ncbi:MAG: murein biosynthesis integral membrane protein MurJ [Chromatiales bacterium]|nr:murein biosynthesis integral membrane protein MurJ [Chromatiales bacterium]
MSRRFLKSTSVVSGMTLLSRVLGLARDIVFARLFGAGIVMDAFFVAFKIPNLLRRFFAEGAFSQAFVPVFAEYKSTRTRAELKELADRVSGTLGLALFVVTLIGVIAAPILIMIFAPGFLGRGEQYDLATAMLRFTFPYILFISLTGLAGAMLNNFGKFAVPAFTPVLLNVVMISAAIWLEPLMPRPGLGLALGVFLAGLVQLFFQLPFLRGIGMLPRPRWGWRDSGVRKIGRLMLPAIFGSSVAQINLLIDTLVASFLAAGSITWLYYADRMMEFPLGVFGVALATVILPGLSEQHAKKSRSDFSATLDWALRLVALIVVPAAVALLVLAAPILATLFFGGRFDAHDVAMSAYSLQAYAIGLLGFSLVKVLAPGYYSRQEMRTPVRIAVIALLVNIVLNLLFVYTMIESGFSAPHAGLALATALAAALNAILLYRGLRKAGVYRPGDGWSWLVVRVGVASAAMALVLWQLAGPASTWLELGLSARIGRLALCIVAGATAYFAVLAILGLRPRHLRGHAPGPDV